MPKSYAGEAVAPQSNTGGEAYLPASERVGRPSFLLAVSPDSWSWDAGVETWLPRLMRILRDPGCGGVGHGPDGKGIDDSYARENARKKGKTILENGDPRLAHVLDGGVYLRRWKAQGSASDKQGWAYSLAWEQPQPGPHGTVKWTWDEERDREVRRGVIDVIGPISPVLIQMDLDKAQQRVDRLRRRIAGSLDPAVRSTYDEAVARRDAMRRAQAAIYPPAQKAEPTPVAFAEGESVIGTDDAEEVPITPEPAKRQRRLK